MNLQMVQTNMNEMMDYIQQLIEENKNLKGQLEIRKQSWASLEEAIIDEKVINNQDQEFIDELTNALIEKLKINVNKVSKNALLVLQMDTSGSMGYYEKFTAKCLCTWLVNILNRKYSDLQVRYIVHHTDAMEVDKDVFFSKGESGGTICSSALSAANDVIEQYDYEDMDVFVFQISDGDNLTSDNEKCIKYINRICNKVNTYGYLEINQYNRHSTLMSCYKHIKHENFVHKTIVDVGQIFEALITFTKRMF